jgi:hypothetical protein
MASTPIVIVSYGAPLGAATAVWVASVGAPPPGGAEEAWIVGYGGSPAAGSAVWVTTSGAVGATAIWIAGFGGTPQ